MHFLTGENRNISPKEKIVIKKFLQILRVYFSFILYNNFNSFFSCFYYKKDTKSLQRIKTNISLLIRLEGSGFKRNLLSEA
jgi:hypothetical protein